MNCLGAKIDKIEAEIITHHADTEVKHLELEIDIIGEYCLMDY